MTGIIKIDRSNLSTKNKDLELSPRLEQFLAQVQLVRPLFSFVACDDNGHYIETTYTHKEGGTDFEAKTILRGVKVFEDGEELGSLFGQKDTYELKSFRINKLRGDENTTSTCNIKVAIRKVKKLFVGRADEELINDIVNRVSTKITNLHGENHNEVRWSFDDDGEGMNYALLAHLARCKGETTITLPSMPASIKSQKQHTDACAKYYESKELQDLLNNAKGYGATLRPDGAYVIYKYAAKTLARYKDFTDMPIDLQTKLGVFKLLQSGEICSFGVMFKPESYEAQKHPNTYFYLKE